MHGRTLCWPAWMLALSVALSACTAALGQQSSPMLPTDPGYMLATESHYALPSIPTAPANARLVSSSAAVDDELNARGAELEAAIKKMKAKEADDKKKAAGSWSGRAPRPRCCPERRVSKGPGTPAIVGG